MKARLTLTLLALVLATPVLAQNTETKPADAAAPATAVPAAAPAAAPAPVPAAPAVVEKAAPAASASADTGLAAYYGKKFAGRRTASGQRFNPSAMTAAHRSLPFGTKVRVTNVKNKHKAVVVINDRGPSSQDRVIDVSYAAAKKLGLLKSGTAEVKLEVIGKTKHKHKK